MKNEYISIVKRFLPRIGILAALVVVVFIATGKLLLYFTLKVAIKLFAIVMMGAGYFFSRDKQRADTNTETTQL